MSKTPASDVRAKIFAFRQRGLTPSEISALRASQFPVPPCFLMLDFLTLSASIAEKRDELGKEFKGRKNLFKFFHAS